MDDVVAVEVTLDNGEKRFFLTWGRIQDRVDPGPVCDLVLRASGGYSLGGKAISARLCGTLRVAADSGDAPYFYECLLGFARQPGPPDGEYEGWRAERAAAMEAGREISYCGRPGSPGLG